MRITPTTPTLHCCATVLGSSGLRLELEEGPERSESRMDWWRIQLLRDGVSVQLTEAKNQAAEDNIDEILHSQTMLLVKKLVSFIGYMSWIASVAPVARLFVSILRRARDEKAA